LAKPIVDGIERDLGGQSQVFRLSVMSELGSVAARRYGVQSVPSLIIFGGDGTPVEVHAGIPKRKEIVDQVELLLQ
jgi:hypothetical protein